MVKKIIALLAIFLSSFMFLGTATTSYAYSDISANFTYNDTIYINQPDQITVTVSGVTPITYQWTTERFTQYQLDNPGYMMLGGVDRVEYPQTDSPTFTFMTSTPGSYNVMVTITYSSGDMGTSIPELITVSDGTPSATPIEVMPTLIPIPTLMSLPTTTPIQSSQNQSPQNTQTPTPQMHPIESTIAGVIIAAAIISTASLLLYKYKPKTEPQKPI
jgi:hypothetical protein